jgi:hypothetical protein
MMPRRELLISIGSGWSRNAAISSGDSFFERSSIVMPRAQGGKSKKTIIVRYHKGFMSSSKTIEKRQRIAENIRNLLRNRCQSSIF